MGGLKMYKEYNAHPKGLKTTDCVVRAMQLRLTQTTWKQERTNRRKRTWVYEL